MSEVERLKAQILEAYPRSRAFGAPPYAAVCDMIDALIKAVRSEDAEWRPIETAPEDGSVFVGLLDRVGELFFCRWDAETMHWRSPGDDVTREYPNHWAPLPAFDKRAETEA